MKPNKTCLRCKKITLILEEISQQIKIITAWKVSKYRVISGPYLDTFQVVNILRKMSLQFQNVKLSISCKIAFYIFFVIKCETFEVKRSIRQFWSNQNWLNKTVLSLHKKTTFSMKDFFRKCDQIRCLCSVLVFYGDFNR